MMLEIPPNSSPSLLLLPLLFLPKNSSPNCHRMCPCSSTRSRVDMLIAAAAINKQV